MIERECGDIDIPSFGDFLRRFGPDSVTILDLNKQEVAAVRCGAEVTPDPVPATSVPDVAGATSVSDPVLLDPATTVLPP